MEGVAALKKQIQKSYRVVKQSLEQWEAFTKETRSDVTLIGNYLEQCECCRDAAVMEAINKHFPDVKKNVLFKIMAELDVKIEHLLSKLEPLEAVCDKITKQKNNTISLYRKHKKELTIDVMVETHVICPSLSQLIEWLVDVDRMFRELYLGKKFWLQNITEADWGDGERMLQEWNEDDMVTFQQIKGSIFTELRKPETCYRRPPVLRDHCIVTSVNREVLQTVARALLLVGEQLLIYKMTTMFPWYSSYDAKPK